MNRPLVTVIIPTYNRSSTLIRSINSVLEQTYSAVELIVVDDGSSDTTREIFTDISNSYVDKKSLYYVYQENSGAPIARNRGAKLANGKYLIFHDSDDFMHPGRIKLQVEEVESRGASLCCGSWTNYPDTNTGYRCPDHSSDPINDFLRGTLLGSNQSWMMTKDIFLKVGGFDPYLKCGQDIDLIFRLLCLRKNVAFSPEATTYFCNSEGDRISNKGLTREGYGSLYDSHLKRLQLLKNINEIKYLKLEADILISFAIDARYLGFDDLASSAVELSRKISRFPSWRVSYLHSFIFRVGGIRASVFFKRLKGNFT